MPEKDCRIIAYTGAHGTGKSTSVFERARLEKIANPTKTVGILCETAAQSPFPINTKTTPESQLWIFSTQLTRELELSQRYDILICDRTLCDAIAYTMAAGYENMYKSMIQMGMDYVHRYDEIIFKTIRNNDWLHADGVRDTTNDTWRKTIESAMREVYDRLSKVCTVNIKYV